MKTSTVANAFVIANVAYALPNLVQDGDRAILAVERRGTVSPRDAPILTGRDDDPVEPPPIGGGGTLGGGSGSGTVTISVNAFTCSNNAVCCKRAYDDGFTTIHCSYYNKAYPTINNCGNLGLPDSAGWCCEKTFGTIGVHCAAAPPLELTNVTIPAASDVCPDPTDPNCAGACIIM